MEWLQVNGATSLCIRPPPAAQQEDAYEIEDEMSDASPTPALVGVDSMMRDHGLIAGSREEANWSHGLGPVQMQAIYMSLVGEHTTHRNHQFVVNRMAEFLSNLSSDCLVLGEHEKHNDLGLKIAITNIGYQTVALGMWVLMFGSYAKNHNLRTISGVAKEMEKVEHKDIARWILAISMGMEHRPPTASGLPQ